MDLRHDGQLVAALGIGTVLGVAAVLRLFELGSVPYPLADEVMSAIDMRSEVSAGHHFTGAPIGILGHIIPVLTGNLPVALLAGPNIEALRIPAAVFGVLTVFLIYLVGRHLFGGGIGLWAACVAAIMPWAIYYSRINFPDSCFGLATAATIWFALRTLDRNRLGDALASGVTAAVSIYVYPPALVSTPLVLLAILGVYAPATRRCWRKVGLAIGSAVVMLVPYGLEHLGVGQNISQVNTVITTRMVWSHGLPFAKVLLLVARDWGSYLTPSYLMFHGDPNPRQSIQVMGEVGWVVAALGAVGAVCCGWRRDRAGLLVLLWLVLYPVADALTFQGAYASSVVGFVGIVPWALVAGVGCGTVVRHRNLLVSRLGAALIAGGLAFQTVAFAGYYFQRYDAVDGYAFVQPSSFGRVAGVLARNGFEHVPVTFVAGYDRNLMLSYFTQGRVVAASWYPSCYALPRSAAAYTVSPRVFVVREGSDYAGSPGCVQQRRVIALTEAELVAEGWHLRVLANFKNAARGPYRTAIVLASRSVP